MAIRQVVGGEFQDSQGNVLANGIIVFELSGDAQLSTSQGELGAGINGKLTLDSTGNVAASPAQNMWPTDQMNPSNLTYTMRAYSSNGQLAWGPNYGLTIPSGGGAFDLDTLVPNQIGSGSGAAAGSLTLQTNGVNNGSQQLLDLQEGSNVTITDNGSGQVTIDAAGGGTVLPASATGPFFIGPGFMATQLPATSSAGVGLVGQIGIARFVLPVGMVIARASFLAQTHGVASNASFAILDSAGNKLIDTGVFTATGFSNPTIFTATFAPVTLPAGTYWQAQTDDSSGSGWQISCFNSATLGQLLNGDNSGFANARNMQGISSTASTAGVIPSVVNVTTFPSSFGISVAAICWESQ